MTTIDPNTRYCVPDGVLTRHVDDEVLLLNTESERYFGLNPVGARLFSLLSDGSSYAHAMQTIADEFAVDPERVDGDCQPLVAQLLERGLLLNDDR